VTERISAVFICVNYVSVFGRPFVKRFALCYQTVVCLSVLSCLSVTLLYCGQTVGQIKMKLGMQVGLGPGHIVLDGDPAPPPPKGYSSHPIFGPYLLWPNGCMDQDATFFVMWHSLAATFRHISKPYSYSHLFITDSVFQPEHYEHLITLTSCP